MLLVPGWFLIMLLCLGPQRCLTYGCAWARAFACALQRFPNSAPTASLFQRLLRPPELRCCSSCFDFFMSFAS